MSCPLRIRSAVQRELVKGTRPPQAAELAREEKDLPLPGTGTPRKDVRDKHCCVSAIWLLSLQRLLSWGQLTVLGQPRNCPVRINRLTGHLYSSFKRSSGSQVWNRPGGNMDIGRCLLSSFWAEVLLPGMWESWFNLRKGWVILWDLGAVVDRRTITLFPPGTTKALL